MRFLNKSWQVAGWTAVGVAGIVLLGTLSAPPLDCPRAAASVALGAPQDYVQYMRSFIPGGIQTVHWTETIIRPKVGSDGEVIAGSHYEGWYRSPNCFRHDYPSNIFVTNGNNSWSYTKALRSYRRARLAPLAELEDFFRPDSVGCSSNYGPMDLMTIRETTGTYRGAPCAIIEMRFKAKAVNVSCSTVTGPCRVYVYLAPGTRRVIARVKDEWDMQERGVLLRGIREYEYNVTLSDSLFIFTPPPGSTMRAPGA